MQLFGSVDDADRDATLHADVVPTADGQSGEVVGADERRRLDSRDALTTDEQSSHADPLDSFLGADRESGHVEASDLLSENPQAADVHSPHGAVLRPG